MPHQPMYEYLAEIGVVDHLSIVDLDDFLGALEQSRELPFIVMYSFPQILGTVVNISLRRGSVASAPMRLTGLPASDDVPRVDKRRFNLKRFLSDGDYAQRYWLSYTKRHGLSLDGRRVPHETA